MDSPNPPIVAPSQPEPSVVAVSPVESGPPADQLLPMPIEQGSAATQRPNVNSFGSDVVSSVQSLMGTIVIAIFVITFIVQAFQIPSESMENTLLVGDYLLVDKLCYGGSGLGDHLMPYQKIQRGDIIVFHYPVDPQQHFVTRVIGEPGDRLRMERKKVLI